MIFLSILSGAAAILLYTGLLFLVISIRKRDRGTYFMFALCSILFGIHLIFKIITIHQETIPEIFLFFKPQVAFEFLAGIFWVWMIAYYTQVKPRRLLWLITSIYLLIATLNLILPYGTVWQKVSGLKPINLPWGESWLHPIGTPHPLLILKGVTAMVVLSFFFYACFRQYQRNAQKASVLAFSLAVLLISVIHIYLVDAGVLHGFISTIPFAFLLMIILISLELVNNIVKTEIQLQYYNTHLEEIIKVRTDELQAAIQEKIVLQERSRLAGELHDSVNQTLHSLIMIADTLPKLEQTHPEEIRPGLNKIKQLARGCLAEMRNLLVELHPQRLVEKPLGELLRQLSQAFSHRTSLNVTTCINNHSHLPPETQICFYRIAQESLNNVVRHAKAKQVEIHFNCQHCYGQSEGIQMLVKDDGLGFNPKDILPSNLGLSIMQKRAEKIGASLKISSQSGQGTEVLLKWPFDQIIEVSR